MGGTIDLAKIDDFRRKKCVSLDFYIKMRDDLDKSCYFHIRNLSLVVLLIDSHGYSLYRGDLKERGNFNEGN